ncbi:MAG: hypothetical protein H6710_06630 [Myxococcales bacterium]|nr:hypothetical protein [Myxococcales bacterium]
MISSAAPLRPAPSTPSPRRAQGGDPSRLWRVLGLPAQRAAAPRPLFDPASCGSFRELAGLFVGPHERALVVCVDGRAAPARPTGAAQPAGDPGATIPGHDERRLALLLEAICLVVERDEGEAIDPRPLLDFLAAIERAVPEELEVHLILDRRASVRDREVQAWFRARSRYHVHFASDHQRWRERALAWLRVAAARQARWRAPSSVLSLESALQRFILRPPADGRAFGWSPSADENLTSLARFLLHRRRR